MEIGNITFDCANAFVLSEFWSKVTERPVAVGATEGFAVIGGRPNLLFLQVDEPKTAKNRCHMDLNADADLDEIKDRLIGFGASFIHKLSEHGISWMTFADPEGNEFCVGEH